MLQDDLPDFGVWSEMMCNKDTPNDDRITAYADLGYLGIKKIFPGIILKQPYKKSKNNKLTYAQHKANKKINGTRVRIEHAIGRIKQYKRMVDPYDKSIEEFNAELKVVTGLVNFKLLWDPGKKKLKLDL